MAGTEHVISMEESLYRKVNFAGIESGETSRERGSNAIEEEASFTPKLISMEQIEKLKKAGANITRNPVAEKTTPKIQEVPSLLRGRKNFEKYFVPRVVSLGPIHHGKNECLAAEDFKLGMASKFVDDSGKSVHFVHGKIAGKIKKLRQYFDEKVANKYDDETLAWMLFVDGCAVLQSIHCAAHQQLMKNLKIKNDQATIAQQDLFLLENQLPYELLEDLMASSGKKEDLKKSIETLIMGMAHARGQDDGKHGETDEEIKPIHLLDLLRTRLLGKKKNGSTRENKCPSNGLINFFPALVKLISSNLINPRNQINEPGGKEVQPYRNVQELKAAGIFVKPAKTNLLTSISFEGGEFFRGFLQLPPIIVDDSTGPKLFNLIAYEMCSDFDNDYGITTYVAFLDSLIDNPEDVKELRNARILHNLLGSDEHVAKLFNEIGTDLVPDSAAYTEVKKKIWSHFETKWKTSIAQVMHDHFSSPWTAVAFLAALLSLALSAAQVAYAVKADHVKK